SKLQVLGSGDLLTQIANCCAPVPGDPIVGFITRSRGVTIHHTECVNVRNTEESERLVDVTWGEEMRSFPVQVRIQAWDRPVAPPLPRRRGRGPRYHPPRAHRGPLRPPHPRLPDPGAPRHRAAPARHDAPRAAQGHPPRRPQPPRRPRLRLSRARLLARAARV